MAPGARAITSLGSGEVEMAAPLVVPSDKPPRAWVILADWGNFLAGVVLTAAFALGYVVSTGAPTPNQLTWLQRLFTWEGFLYAEAEFWMVGIMAMTPPEFGGGATGCLQFAILMAGGIFFTLSGFVYPGCISHVKYVFSSDVCPHPAAGTPYIWNAMAHYGITCFMIATTMGLRSVWPLPKNKVISPFWGVACFFIGAWTIGVVGLWGPCLADGLTTYETLKGGEDLLLPPYTWTWTHFFQVVGALFLTAGAIIFGIMDNICCGSIDGKSCNTDGTSDLETITNNDV